MLFKLFYTTIAVNFFFADDELRQHNCSVSRCLPIERTLFPSVCIEYMGDGRRPTTSFARKISFCYFCPTKLRHGIPSLTDSTIKQGCCKRGIEESDVQYSICVEHSQKYRFILTKRELWKEQTRDNHRENPNA